MEAVVRTARPEEAEALAALASRLFHETYDPVSDPEDVAAYASEHFGAARQAAELRDPACTVLLAEVDGRLAGYAQLRRGEAPPGVGGERAVEVARFYVDAPFHGTGVARALMEASLAAAGAEGADAVWLPVWKRNGRAVAFYRKHGFQAVGEQTFLMGSDLQEDHVMARPVP